LGIGYFKEEGFTYDSSIFSGDAKRTGIPGFDPKIQQLNNGLLEFPISTVKVFNFDFGVGGGISDYYPTLLKKDGENFKGAK
jgi:hypothetical protein